MIQKKLRIEFASEDGLLIRLAMLLERRSFRMDSYKVYRNDSGSGWMFLTISGNPSKYDQILKQIRKLVDVVGVCEEGSAEVFMIKKQEVMLVNSK